MARLGTSKWLMVFEREEDFEHAKLKGKAWWARWFDSTQLWKEETQIDASRDVWLRCFGVPLQAYCVNTLMAIGYVWGEVLGVELGSLESGDLRTGKVCVRTNEMGVMQKEIELRVDNRPFRCQIVEEFGCLKVEGKRLEQEAEKDEPTGTEWRRSLVGRRVGWETGQDDDVAGSDVFPCLERTGKSSGRVREMAFTELEDGVKSVVQAPIGVEERRGQTAKGKVLRGEEGFRNEDISSATRDAESADEDSESIVKETPQTQRGKRQRMLTARAVSPGLGGKEADNLDHLGFYSEDCGPASAFQEIQLVVDLGHYDTVSSEYRMPRSHVFLERISTPTGNTSLQRIRLAQIYRTQGGRSGEMEGLSGGVSRRPRRT
ncbi:hypothetical protein Dimus_015143 [Dionaea muscipula]